MSNDGKPNPFPLVDDKGKFIGWCWHDEDGKVSKVHASEGAALHDLLRHIRAMPWWKRLLMDARKLWRDQKGDA
jgi:hypothetical protein